MKKEGKGGKTRSRKIKNVKARVGQKKKVHAPRAPKTHYDADARNRSGGGDQKEDTKRIIVSPSGEQEKNPKESMPYKATH